MVPQLIACVDGLPVSLLDRERVWPAARVGAGADHRAGGRVRAVGDPLRARAGGAAVMRGHNPVGWAATLLIAVAYAHVLLELAAAVLAVAVAARLLLSPARELIGARRCRRLDRRWAATPVVERPPAREPGAQLRRPAS